MSHSERLGARWFAYCGGAPRDAWKAAAWLSEGGPEKPRQAPQTPASEAQERAAKARRAEEAKARERDYERKKREEMAAPPPPEALAFLRSTPASGTRMRTAEDADVQAQLEQLMAEEERLKAAGDGE